MEFVFQASTKNAVGLTQRTRLNWYKKCSRIDAAHTIELGTPIGIRNSPNYWAVSPNVVCHQSKILGFRVLKTVGLRVPICVFDTELH